jgi:hypothetical protein
MAFTLVQNISGTECIGTSRPKLVNNFLSLESEIIALSADTIRPEDSGTVSLIYNNSSRSLQASIKINSIEDSYLKNPVNPLSLAKAWVNFNGTPNQPTTNGSPFNVSTISKTGIGQYTIYFETPFTDANYVPIITVFDNSIAGGTLISGSVVEINTDYLRISVQSQQSGVNGVDANVYLVVFGI